MPARQHYSALAGLLLFLLLLVVTPIWAQEPQESFGETFEVAVVEVDVLVTDRGDQSIPDLTKEDFQLFEDGEQVEITNFYTVREGRRPDLDPALADSVEPLYLTIFVDDLNITMQSRNRILKQVKEFVNRELRPGDFAMIVRSADRVRIEQTLTQDLEVVSAALDRVQVNTSRGNATALERRSIISNMERLGPSEAESDGGRTNETLQDDAGQLLLDIRSHSQERYDLIRTTAGILGELVTDLGGLPGRKALLYVSDNIDYRPGEALFQAWERKFSAIASVSRFSTVGLESAALDTTPIFRDLTNHANTNRVSFYTIGAPPTGAMATGGSFDPAMPGVGGGGQVLGFMAAATGGRFYEGGASGSFLDLMRQDFDTYYSLGYAKQPAEDEKAHRIEVKVVGHKGVRVLHRERYEARSRADRIADRTRTALVLGITENPLGIKVEFEDAEKQDKAYRVPILVKTPLSKLVLIPQGDFHVGRITVFVAAQDEQGRTSAVQRFQVPIRIRNDQLLGAMSQVAGYRVVLLLRDGEQAVAIGVQDDMGIEQAVIRTQWSSAAKG